MLSGRRVTHFVTGSKTSDARKPKKNNELKKEKKMLDLEVIPHRAIATDTWEVVIGSPVNEVIQSLQVKVQIFVAKFR